MDPRTGEIYAMATYPSFDPNAFSDRRPEPPREPRGDRYLRAGLGEQDDHRRRGAESSAVVRPTDTFQVAGTRSIEGYTIHDAESHAHGDA